MLRLFFAASTLCFIACGSAQHAELRTSSGTESSTPGEQRRPLVLWEVRKNGELEGYLHGSVHVLPEDQATPAAAVTTAYEASDLLVVEVDVTAVDQTRMAALVERYGRYPEGQNLRQHVSADTWTITRGALNRVGIPEAAALQLKPWLLSLTLATLSLAEQGLSGENGVDQTFLTRAHQPRASKPIRALETAEGQIRALAELSDEVQELNLRDAASTGLSVASIIEAWRLGDTTLLAELILTQANDPAYAPLYEALFYRRNEKMADRLETLFPEGVLFVVIGAGHLVGERSVVDLLRGRGFVVTQMYSDGLSDAP